MSNWRHFGVTCFLFGVSYFFKILKSNKEQEIRNGELAALRCYLFLIRCFLFFLFCCINTFKKNGYQLIVLLNNVCHSLRFQERLLQYDF